MRDRMVQPKAAWAEDRATQRCDPSADPGAKTGAGARHCLALLPFYPLRDWHESDKPSRHDAATLLAGCLPQPANAKRQEFQFPLNQDTTVLTTAFLGLRAATGPLQMEGNATLRACPKSPLSHWERGRGEGTGGEKRHSKGYFPRESPSP
jgi:hypothetical protein